MVLNDTILTGIAPQESDGIVLVWSLYLHHQPEFVFTAEVVCNLYLSLT